MDEKSGIDLAIQNRLVAVPLFVSSTRYGWAMAAVLIESGGYNSYSDSYLGIKPWSKKIQRFKEQLLQLLQLLELEM
jgi:hypothetical protein